MTSEGINKLFLGKYFDNDFADTLAKCTLYAIIGLILGLVVNILAQNTTNMFNTSRATKIFIQIIYCVIALTLLRTNISFEISESLLHTYQGLFFVGLFFGAQFITPEEIERHFLKY